MVGTPPNISCVSQLLAWSPLIFLLYKYDVVPTPVKVNVNFSVIESKTHVDIFVEADAISVAN